MRIRELWRYPVKSMRGERIDRARVDAYGVPGDRELYVVGADGRVITARTAPGLLRMAATRDADGEVLIDGRPWPDPEVTAGVQTAAGPGSRLVRAQGPERFDVMPLSVVTDGALDAFGHDHRRLRPNLVIEGVDGLAERKWPRCRALRIGDTVLGLARLRDRCVITTWDPDTLESDPEVLVDLHVRFEGHFALDAWAIVDGGLAVGDPVELLDAQPEARRPKLGRNVPGHIGSAEQRR